MFFYESLSALVIMFKQKIISTDDPRVLNPTFDFKVPWSDIDRDCDEIIIMDEDDDIFTCIVYSQSYCRSLV